jgi:hypothetical protein
MTRPLSAFNLQRYSLEPGWIRIKTVCVRFRPIIIPIAPIQISILPILTGIAVSLMQIDLIVNWIKVGKKLLIHAPSAFLECADLSALSKAATCEPERGQQLLDEADRNLDEVF